MFHVITSCGTLIPLKYTPVPFSGIVKQFGHVTLEDIVDRSCDEHSAAYPPLVAGAANLPAISDEVIKVAVKVILMMALLLLMICRQQLTTQPCSGSIVYKYLASRSTNIWSA